MLERTLWKHTLKMLIWSAAANQEGLPSASPSLLSMGVILSCGHFNKRDGIASLSGGGRFRLYNLHFPLKTVQSEAASSAFVLACCWAFFSTEACSPSETVEHGEGCPQPLAESVQGTAGKWAGLRLYFRKTLGFMFFFFFSPWNKNK